MNPVNMSKCDDSKQKAEVVTFLQVFLDTHLDNNPVIVPRRGTL